MQHLFWRFFLLFWASLLVTMLLVRLTFSLQTDGEPGPDARPFANAGPPPFAERRLGPRPEHLPAPPFWRRPAMHLAFLLIASVLFSWRLAHYITRPVRTLQQALDNLAQQQWQTQLGAPLTQRRDEFGKLSRSFNLMAAQAAEAIASQRRLLHDVSHELRSPLARLQLLTGLAAQTTPTPADTLERIEQEATKLDKLVHDILMFSQLDSGMRNSTPVKVELAEMLGSICDDAKLEADAGNKTLWLQLDPVAPILADPSLLYCAIENIVRNAVKYTAPYTEVSITLRQHADDIRLQVQDQGPGVPEDQLPKLFTPFFRAHSTHHGIGLGLSITKRAIEQCNGSISVRNMMHDNNITGFCVTLNFRVDSSEIQPD